MATTYITDTHSLLWYLQGSSQLGVAARQVFDDVVAGTANLVIPVMVMAEMVLLLEKGRAAIDLDAILGTVYSLPAVTIAPLTLEVTLGIRELSVLPDMHDRLIVAEAVARLRGGTPRSLRYRYGSRFCAGCRRRWTP